MVSGVWNYKAAPRALGAVKTKTTNLRQGARRATPFGPEIPAGSIPASQTNYRRYPSWWGALFYKQVKRCSIHLPTTGPAPAVTGKATYRRPGAIQVFNSPRSDNGCQVN